ncbi:hypothetical protein SUGI_0912450 [Cryptomeria japonica]|uniref:probable pectinesterase 53 n=1 Tax=Cryptomeria japonica TaxID=3369 RepID=UPI002414CA91|nr:probable pectinesterase 53 [Cryptomeria japonica]GLJ43824.1 hypothetical protein SUGI_0912450 [Cryptomeria japonica]
MLKQQIMIVVVFGIVLFISLVEANATVHKEKPVHTRALNIQDEYTKWIRWMGTLNHSLYKPAKNKVFPSSYLVVDTTDGVGDFTSVQEAIDSLPLFNVVRVVIKINAGVYKEKVNIPITKAFVTLEGAGADSTIIQWGDMAGTLGPDGKPLGTYNSATVAVNSPYFIAKNITFKNTAPIPPPGAVGRQAVALRITGDTAAFFGCSFLGAQDTLYDHIGRHYFKDCYIEGSVDFIFGNGLSMYEGCVVHGISDTYGAVTAQKRESSGDDTGFAFVRCKVTGSGALYLGRAWGTFSRVVFAYTYMDKIIMPVGWHNMGDPHKESTVFYGQYKCSGAGASFSGRVSWSRELTDEEVKPFLALSFIDGHDWISL